MTKPKVLGKKLAILVAGKAGVGKSTTAKYLKEYYKNLGYSVGVFPFATGVKLTALKMGWDGQKDEKGRKLLQEVGSTGRHYDIDIWVKYTERLIEQDSNEYDIIISDDWRYPNESEYFKNNPMYSCATVRIHAPDREILKGTSQEFHESETSLPESGCIYNYVVENLEHLEGLSKSCNTLGDLVLDEQAVIYE